MPARNEASNLPECLKSLLNQTVRIRPENIRVVNDASVDNTGEIARKFGCDVIDLHENHPNYARDPYLVRFMAKILNHAFEKPITTPFFMQHAPDVILENDYAEKLLKRFSYDPKLVIASGSIVGEFNVPEHVRGVGRIHRTTFWIKYVKKYPLLFTYETYPLYVADSLGYHYRSFYDLKMLTQRPTKRYSDTFGWAMAEANWFEPYVLAKIVFLSAKGKIRAAKNMLVSYIRSPYKKKYSPMITKAIRLHQAKRMLGSYGFKRLKHDV